MKSFKTPYKRSTTATRRAELRKQERQLHVSRPIVMGQLIYKDEHGKNAGITYNVGRNAAKRAKRNKK